MRRPQFYPGALLTDDKGLKTYLVLSYHRSGHQYERYWTYTVLYDGTVLEIDDFDFRMRDVNVVDTLESYR